MSESDEPPTVTTARSVQRRFEADRLTKFLLFLSFISLVVLAGLAVLIQRNSANNDDVSESIEAMETSIIHLESFVEDLETETPEEVAQNAAVTAAVRQVPEIRAILCEQFPAASACRE